MPGKSATAILKEMCEGLNKRLDEDIVHVKGRLDSIETRLDKMNGMISLLRWAIPVVLASVAILAGRLY